MRGRSIYHHRFELKVECLVTLRYALWHQRFQPFWEDAWVEQTMTHEVHKIGKFLSGELDWPLQQRIETSQYRLDRAERSLQV
jgi:hypothetical protein